MIIIAVDFGKARTGLAVCDPSELLASPLTVIKENNRQRLLAEIARCCTERRAEAVVVGLPKNMDGTEGESALNARELGAQLMEKTGLTVDFFDERGTTITAHGYLNATDTRGKKRKETVDAVAAVIILEDYLMARRNRS